MDSGGKIAKVRSALLTLLCLLPSAALADRAARSEEDEFFDLERATLEQALNIKTSVASRRSSPLRETPGLVTVITREEIQAMGARNVQDVLKLVPELDFAVDVQGNLGLGVRGNWANEGKVLLMWDGQVYNETLYSTIQFDRFPVDQIEEIEVIKGPGSALYGGFAELAVINVRTRCPRALNGSSAYAAYGQGERARARMYGGYSYGAARGGAEFSAKAFWGQAQRSDRRYTDLAGASYGMNGSSDLNPRSLNLFASRDGTSLRLIFDDFSLRERDSFGAALSSGAVRNSFRTLLAEVARKVMLPGGVSLEPKLNYARARPWLERSDYPYDKLTDRVIASVYADKRFGAGLDLMGGWEYFHDSVSVDRITEPGSQYPDGRTGTAYDNYAFYGQAALDSDIVNLTAGARYDKHSHYGASLVPRVAVTKIAGGYNFKAIYSQAFRAPSIENIRLNPDIAPEKATSGELEAGYRASDLVYISANVFQTTIKRPIVFGVYGDKETYANYDRTGTRGAGASFKFKSGAARADLAYQCYAARGNRVDVYAVPGHGSYLLAFPRHKVALNSFLPLRKGLGVNLSAVYYSRRYGYAYGGSPRLFPETTIADLNFQLKDRPLSGLTLNLGVKDLFNSGFSYLQPYDGGHAPLPAASRELFVKAAYDF